jgi:hypothetical protein
MNGYHAYLMGPDGHIQSRVDLTCEDEEAAKEQAKQLVDGHDVELWQLAKTVGTKSDSYRRSHDLDLSGHGPTVTDGDSLRTKRWSGKG